MQNYPFALLCTVVQFYLAGTKAICASSRKKICLLVLDYYYSSQVKCSFSSFIATFENLHPTYTNPAFLYTRQTLAVLLLLILDESMTTWCACTSHATLVFIICIISPWVDFVGNSSVPYEIKKLQICNILSSSREFFFV